MTKFVYFVAYKTASQFGRCHIIRDSLVTDISDIEEMEHSIVALGRVTTLPVVITNYQILRTEEVNDGDGT
jgi:hypothetical protein